MTRSLLLGCLVKLLSSGSVRSKVIGVVLTALTGPIAFPVTVSAFSVSDIVPSEQPATVAA
jgi:hypothetical protein